MELRHLRYFTAVAAHGSFQRAAETLHVTPPALSRQVKDLEEELGVTLFVRGKNLITLTDAGDTFYEEACDVLARAAQAIQRVRGAVKAETLRVGFVSSLTAGLLPAAIGKFQLSAPKVKLELSDLNPHEMSQRVAAGGLDLAIMPAGLETATPHFVWSELVHLAAVLILPRTHAMAKLKKIPPARLRGCQLRGLGRTNFPEYAPRLRTILKPFGLSPRFTDQSADSVASLFAALEANHEVVVLTEGIAEALPPTLVMRPFAPALAASVIKVGLPAVRPNPHAETFAQILREGVNRIRRKT
ncbi:LysR family transcriptional regulator [Synoicihabitans lomoniglobus]|uniref:LysR family transcriptional regulator n=1 Tax=Synoicihabitans lomoniglobus TaxID=2909285 RepID=A0AAF0A160_9BACT|nr:LysR family transcriptional regulator [Opitutaceae bacterium LMO-M01]WED65488.1 LysR family transcriptional regulator [Opitutaceae bacterium LMO-M01]